MTRRSSALAGLAALLAIPAAAHPAFAHGYGAGGAGLVGGFLHPLGGWDHLLAILAVGVWAAQLGGRAFWAAPSAFVCGLVPGALLAAVGIGLAGVETGILASLVLGGLLIALAVRPPLDAGLALVTLFGLVHGHAHGSELPAAASPLLYGLGFVSASILSHVLGVALGAAARRLSLPLLPRLGGGAVAAAGLLGLVFG